MGVDRCVSAAVGGRRMGSPCRVFCEEREAEADEELVAFLARTAWAQPSHASDALMAPQPRVGRFHGPH